MREVKCREAIYQNGNFVKFHYWGYNDGGQSADWETMRYNSHDDSFEDGECISNEQFTGMKDRDGKEIYEGDMFRIEVENDHGDERDYAIVTWIKEWCMFATLLSGEYKEYLDQGASILDEVMFWSYTLQDASENKIIGNIHETPIPKG